MRATEHLTVEPVRRIEHYGFDPHELERRATLSGKAGTLLGAIENFAADLDPGESIALTVRSARTARSLPCIGVRAEVVAHEGCCPSLAGLSARLRAALQESAGELSAVAPDAAASGQTSAAFSLVPPGVRVVLGSAHAIGFLRQDSTASEAADTLPAAILPPLQRSPPGPGNAYGALAAHAGAAIDIVFSSRALDHHTLKRLQDLLHAIESGHVVAEHVDRIGPIPQPIIELLRPHWVETLKRTMASGRAVQAAATFCVPGSDVHAARALARLAWPGCNVHQGPIQPVAVTDLRTTGCANALLARVLPDPKQRSILRGMPAWVGAESAAGPDVDLGHDGIAPVRLTDAELTRHMHIVGATGTGKSTLMRSMIRQQMEAGCGLAVIDPHGDLIADVLDDVPAARRGDIVLFDPSDPVCSPGLNHFEPTGAAAAPDASALANELIDMFGQMYNLDRAGGPVFEQYFRAAVQLLLCNTMPGMTLCEVPLVFESGGFRRALTARCTSPETAGFWRRQAEPATGDLSMSAIAPYITSKLHQFTHNSTMRDIIGQSSSTVDFASVMDGRGILLANLSRGTLGLRESSLIGMVLMSRLFRTAMARTSRPRARRTPFTVYIDEVQTCLSEHVATALSEARKGGLRLVLAHQHLSQIDRGREGHNLLETVLANAATLVAFRVGADDAHRLERLLAPTINAGDLVGLPDFTAAVRREGLGGGQFARIIDTAKPRTVSAVRSTAAIRQEQLSRNSRPRSEIDKEIAARRERCLGAGAGAASA